MEILVGKSDFLLYEHIFLFLKGKERKIHFQFLSLYLPCLQTYKLSFIQVAKPIAHPLQIIVLKLIKKVTGKKEREHFQVLAYLGYHYVDGVHEAENQQVLVCGSNGRYFDRSNANLISAEKQVNEAAKCVKKVGPGCRDIVQQNALISKRTCDGASIDGCSLVVTCKPGIHPFLFNA